MISVIVPIYKVERYLRQCLDSIINQTYRDLEILLIDDGSPDKCGEICEEYAQKDNRIRVFHTENRGLSAARNLGLYEANGEYIGFVDSDDWIEPDMYAKLLRQIELTKAEISVCGVWNEFLEDRYDYGICDGIFTRGEAIQALICDLISNVAWNKLYKRNCWEGVSFLEQSNYEEIATIYKVVLKTHSVSSSHEQLYHYRMRDSSIVHTRSMKNLMDYWSAYYNRYTYFCSLPKSQKDQKTIDILEKQIVLASIRIWRWIYTVPRQQRDYSFLLTVSSLMRTKFPLFGKRNWRLFLRAGTFATRYINETLFAFLYSMRCFHSFITERNKTPFPF